MKDVTWDLFIDSIDSVSGIIFFMILLEIQWEFFFYRPVNTDKPNFDSFLVFVGTEASFTAKIHLLKLSRNEKPFWIPSQNSEYPRIFRVTQANQNARKLLSTDLVNTTNKYNADRKYESERHFSNTTHIAIICALEFSCKFDTEPFKQKRKTNTKRKFAEPQIDYKFFEFSVLRFSYYIGTRQSNPLTISYR